MKYFLILLFIISINLNAQKRNYIWCFGDSAGIDFNNISSPSVFSTGNDTHGSNCAIADSSGNLLFYASTSYLPYYLSGNVYMGAIFNKNHTLMANGDSSIGLLFYNEVIIIPLPSDDSLYYVFFAGVGPIYGLYYTLVNLNANGGLGIVLSKNNQLVPFAQIDCLNAIKHGNGRDWWLFFRQRYPSSFTPNNEFYSFLISPAGITNFSMQNVGSLQTDGGGKLTFSKNGNILIYSGWRGLIEKYDFDRCTGIISNPITIQPENTVNFDTLWVSNEISPNSNILYVSTSDFTSFLFQYDLTAPNIAASRQTIWSTNYPVNSGGTLKRGPNDKIYLACRYTNAVYPYPDSVFNMYNMNLSVINQPDSLGAACDFQPYSFYLGGKRTYWGLPNNPDYDLGCDTTGGCPCLTGVPGIEQGITKAELFVTWVSSWQKLFVNAQHLKGRMVTVEVFNVAGKNLAPGPSPQKRGASPNTGYFTQDIFLPNLSAGVYVVKLQTEKETLSRKFVVSE
ncbi:MAG: T9SS type A sorting domain-containing protein [Bacteroidia bacterium]|nr:T9SS type A sorting domain-containing protein [Bacteroidia bacterium]